MPKHIRFQKRMEDESNKKDGYFEKLRKMMPSYHIRQSPKQMFGTMVMILLLLIAVAMGLHYFGMIDLSKYIPQLGSFKKVSAPSQSLQYFFF